MFARVLLTAALLLLPTAATTQTDDELYATHLGDGMRAYVEGRYDEALTQLYRAVAVQPNALALKLIVRTHDFQGNCSAREASVAMLGDLFPGEPAPAPQRCASVGDLEIRCASSQQTVRVDGAFDAPCGSQIVLPVGPHTLEAAMGISTLVEIRAGELASADLGGGPGKWYLDAPPRVALPARWQRPSLLEDPDMPRGFKWKRPD